MNPTERAAWIALNHLLDIGPRRFHLLREHFPSIRSIWQAKVEDLRCIPQFSNKLINKLARYCQQTDPEKIAQQVFKQNIQVLTLLDEDYPSALRHLFDPPPVLYWKGQIEVLRALSHRHVIAMIGTRKATPYGRKTARKMAWELAQADITIVSGLAYGIDAESHRGALDAKGHTIAVLGNGVDIPYPEGNKEIYRAIEERGVLLSEFPPGTHPTTWTFPMRNRIVSGLSQGVVVVEAGKKSGTMITVDCAHEQGRDVFAIPGLLTSPQSEGTHILIQQGAWLLTDISQIFENLGWQAHELPRTSEQKQGKPKNINLTKEEDQVYGLLSELPQHIDILVTKYQQDAKYLMGLLTILEMKGIVQQLPGKQYVQT